MILWHDCRILFARCTEKPQVLDRLYHVPTENSERPKIPSLTAIYIPISLSHHIPLPRHPHMTLYLRRAATIQVAAAILSSAICLVGGVRVAIQAVRTGWPRFSSEADPSIPVPSLQSQSVLVCPYRIYVVCSIWSILPHPRRLRSWNLSPLRNDTTSSSPSKNE